LQSKPANPSDDERYATREAEIEKRTTQNEDAGKYPMCDATKILGELIRWRDANEGKSKSVVAMPMLEGLKKCRLPGPTGARKIALDPMATVVAKTIGKIRSFG